MAFFAGNGASIGRVDLIVWSHNRSRGGGGAAGVAWGRGFFAAVGEACDGDEFGEELEQALGHVGAGA